MTKRNSKELEEKNLKSKTQLEIHNPVLPKLSRWKRKNFAAGIATLRNLDSILFDFGPSVLCDHIIGWLNYGYLKYDQPLGTDFNLISYIEQVQNTFLSHHPELKNNKQKTDNEAAENPAANTVTSAESAGQTQVNEDVKAAIVAAVPLPEIMEQVEHPFGIRPVLVHDSFSAEPIGYDANSSADRSQKIIAELREGVEKEQREIELKKLRQQEINRDILKQQQLELEKESLRKAQIIQDRKSLEKLMNLLKKAKEEAEKPHSKPNKPKAKPAQKYEEIQKVK